MTTPMEAVAEDLNLNTSAEFGECFIVAVDYYTNPDGSQWDGEGEQPRTLHGPFETSTEADEWIYAYPDGDTDIEDFIVLVMNKVRP